MPAGIESIRRHKLIAQLSCEAVVFAIAAMLVVHVASSLKRGDVPMPLAAVDAAPVMNEPTFVEARGEPATLSVVDTQHAAPTGVAFESEPIAIEDTRVRWFDGRMVRPTRTIWMTVTAYSPDHRSCGHWADGRTAVNTSVWRHGMELVAADTRLLPFGSLLSVPGYANEKIVPVLDRGGAIKGARLDVLYATHAEARVWGVQRLPVTVWEYVDEEAESARALGG